MCQTYLCNVYKKAELSGGGVGFGKMKADVDFTVDGYALAVCNEIRKALKGLVEKKVITKRPTNSNSNNSN